MFGNMLVRFRPFGTRRTKTADAPRVTFFGAIGKARLNASATRDGVSFAGFQPLQPSCEVYGLYHPAVPDGTGGLLWGRGSTGRKRHLIWRVSQALIKENKDCGFSPYILFLRFVDRLNSPSRLIIRQFTS